MKKQKFIYILIIIILLTLFISSNSLAADPKLISTLKKAFDQIKSWLLKLATPAAAVGVCTGLFMKKFSLGDEEKIRLGKKIVNNTLFSYAFVLAIDLVLSAIETLIG